MAENVLQVQEFVEPQANSGILIRFAVFNPLFAILNGVGPEK